METPYLKIKQSYVTALPTISFQRLYMSRTQQNIFSIFIVGTKGVNIRQISFFFKGGKISLLIK